MAMNIIHIFSVLKLFQWAWESYLRWLNKNFYSDKERQNAVMKTLGIGEDEFRTTVEYTRAKDVFGWVSSTFDVALLLLALQMGFFSWWDQWCAQWFDGQAVIYSLSFLLGLSLLSQCLQWPWEYYQTFVIEERFGFNKQTPRAWFFDQCKMMIVSLLLTIPLLWCLLWVMHTYAQSWWWLAALLIVVFMIFTSWFVPVVISPLFNKFKSLEDGDLKEGITRLCQDIGFSASEVSIMDASIRSSHGNAYFTGLFKSKKIVLFDTLVQSMSVPEILSVLAHELGHFKCHHIKKRLGVSILMVFVVFFALRVLSADVSFTAAFGLEHHVGGILLVASFWWPLLQIFLTPIMSQSSRAHEFEADRFAMQYTSELGEALKKLSKHNHSMPLSHPLFSKVYYSHPPILERLAALHK